MMARILMIGTSLQTHGGVAAVTSVYRAAGLFEGREIRYLATHCDGGVGKKFIVALIAWLRFASMLIPGAFDLLHVHSASGPSFWRKFMFIAPTLLVAKPVVLHWHGGGFIEFYESSSKWQQILIGWVFCRCSRVIALSDQWYGILSTMFPSARVVTIPNPVAVPLSAVVLKEASRKVVFLGRINADKGVQDLLHALPTVLASVPGCIVVIAGSGEIDRFRTLAIQLGVAESVQFPGWVDGSAKSALLQAAAVFVLPSHLEAMPMSVLEAMALGLPVVATRVGGIPQAVRDGVDGLLVPPRDATALANALIRLLTDMEFRCALGSSGRQRVQEQFATELIIPRVRTVWATVLNEHSAV
jgi:glycosyltransferase involved in cell wall biosynthesis